MADFLHQSQAYDEAKIREDLANLSSELQDEKDLAAELDSDPAAQLAAAMSFADENEETIGQLKAELDQLSAEIRELVLSNKAKQAALAELDTLTKSERFQAIANDLAGLKAKLAAEHNFLVEQGVEGRRF